MNTLEQLESDEREAGKAYTDYYELGRPLRDKWMELKFKLNLEKLKAEIMAEELSKIETK